MLQLLNTSVVMLNVINADKQYLKNKLLLVIGTVLIAKQTSIKDVNEILQIRLRLTISKQVNK